jgi:acetylornithine deacetylase/succinyl-diaminopimelate desuccinylase-like protein
MRRVIVTASLAFVFQTPLAAAATPTPDQAEARRLLETAVAFKSSARLGETPQMAAWLAKEFLARGFAQEDIEIVAAGASVGLIVRYRGDGSSDKPPILFLAHMDVVEAERSDWATDPFTLAEKDGRFYGRGVADNKFGIVGLVHAFLRLKREAFVPSRDLVLAFSGDEETAMATTQALVARLKGAEFALNSDAGGGIAGAEGKPPVFYVQSAEKTYATFEMTARNRGGHSSEPRRDNAIHDLARALERLDAHEFPVMWNDVTLRSLSVYAGSAEPELAGAIEAFVKNPRSRKAAKRLSAYEEINPTLRTTCAPTMLKAGHAENALPQTATATINCRIFPGVPVDAVKDELVRVAKNPALEFRTLDEPVESPPSELRADVEAAIVSALSQRAPGAVISPYMEAGASDGLHFRRAGIPTFGASAMIRAPSDSPNMHGAQENIPVAAFYESLDHWVAIMKALSAPP